jgi:hypothetical protein
MPNFYFIFFLALSLLARSAQADPQPLTLASAQKIFDALPGDLSKKFGLECGDRAHVWSYLLQNQFQVDSQKIFLYYTTPSFNYTKMLWGFHVATVIHIGADEYVIEKIPHYIVRDQGGFYLDETKLQYPSPLPLKDWLKASTGFTDCKRLDLNNSADKESFAAFNSVRPIASTENCIIAITPAAYWWPGDVYSAVMSQNYLTDASVPATQAMTACMDTYPAKHDSGAKAACTQLLGLTP